MDKQNFYNQLCEEENQLLKEVTDLTETLTAVQILKKRYQVETPGIQPTKADLFTPESTVKREYKKRSGTTASDHVLEALKLVGTGTANQVASTIIELYPDDYTEEKARGNAKFLLSKLNREGKVIGKKIEGKNSFLYTLLTSDNNTNWLNNK